MVPANPARGRRIPRPYLIAGSLLLVLAALTVAAVMFITSKPSLSSDSSALARVGMPLGGGTLESVSVLTGPHSQSVPVQIRGDQLWPRVSIPAHQQVTLDVVVRRPGWIGWLAGATERLSLALRTPAASLRSHYITLGARAPLRLHFRQPIQAYAFGQPGHLHRHVLQSPQSVVTLPRDSAAGSVFVSATPRRWESAPAALVSWFPRGASGSAVANPAPGSVIKPDTPITLTFSKPLHSVLGSRRLAAPTGATGSWHAVNSHTLSFRPSGYGYGLGAKVTVPLPHGVTLVGGQHTSTFDGGTWSVPPGSIVRLQQLLSLLHYLPLQFNYRGPGVGLSPSEQLAAAIKPPSGHFAWRYADTPSALKAMWQAGAYGPVTKGALMAFENDHGLAADGVAGPVVWRELIKAALAGRTSSFGYTFVSVSKGSQSLSLWHNGRTILHTPVNTGIASAPTATGTYPVYEHLAVTTMSGTNPDGSHYHDPGIQWVSYFNGGDALHGFTRAQFGFPQSLGCVEMPVPTAGKVYPFTPIGTLVHVA